MSLFLKLLAPESGGIYIDGTDLGSIDAESLYKNVGLVTQDPFLFNDSIRENITLGRTDIGDETIWEAIRLAHAEDFIQALPSNIHNTIGDRGDLLSGGEKQRITIARALLEDPDILILDEPTSALDPEAERKVSLAVTDALKDRTAIIIAHRLSTIKYADRILVLYDGKLVEEGPHNELMALGGVYADYVRLQTI